MGVALKNQGKLDEAIEAHKKSISIKPDDANGYYNIGNLLQEQLKLDEAIEYYSKSISLKVLIILMLIITWDLLCIIKIN